MEAEKNGVLKIDMLKDGIRSTQPFSRRILFPSGPKGHKIVIPTDQEKNSIRFGFDDKSNRILITRMTLEKKRNINTLNFKALSENIIAQPGLKWEVGSNGIIVSPQAGKTQLAFHNIKAPIIWPAILFSIFLSIPLVEAVRLFSERNRYNAIFMLKILMPVLLILYWYSVTGNQIPLYLTMITTATAALMFTMWRMAQPLKTRLFYQGEIIGTMVIIAIFSLMIFSPFLKMLSPKVVKTVSANLKNSIAKENTESWNEKLKGVQRTFASNFVKYFPDRINLIQQNAWIKIFLFGKSPSPKAIYGKNGMFFEGYGKRRVEGDITRAFDNVTDYIGLSPFSTEELESWRKLIEERYFWLKERDIDYIFAIAPVKAQIYQENLPDRILKVKNRLNRPNRYDQLLDHLKRHCAAPVVDLKKALQTAKKQPPFLPLYYRTDFHWNYYGAFIAYQAIVESINQYYPQYHLNIAKLNEFDIDRKDDWVHNRFLSMIGLNPVKHQDETFFTFYPKNNNRYHNVQGFVKNGISDYSLPKTKSIRIKNKNIHIREYHNEFGKLSRMLVIGDSFVEKAAAYFSVHSRNTINFRTVDHFPTSLIDTLKPDLVVQELLNMYLLKSPPENPKIVKRQSIRAN
ncbi:hypothetical protein QUF75_00210 [Desulfococcaceae bacterium HSG7]|nr:hypothetical protein [Desulfococcaceae bacterium HSG7]